MRLNLKLFFEESRLLLLEFFFVLIYKVEVLESVWQYFSELFESLGLPLVLGFCVPLLPEDFVKGEAKEDGVNEQLGEEVSA